jgi:hypothetical protein
MTTEQTCANCRFYFSRNDECRRHPPAKQETVIALYSAQMLRDIAWSMRAQSGRDNPVHDDAVGFDPEEFDGFRWPFVDEDNWCGEYAARTT